MNVLHTGGSHSVRLFITIIFTSRGCVSMDARVKGAIRVGELVLNKYIEMSIKYTFERGTSLCHQIFATCLNAKLAVNTCYIISCNNNILCLCS